MNASLLSSTTVNPDVTETTKIMPFIQKLMDDLFSEIINSAFPHHKLEMRYSKNNLVIKFKRLCPVGDEGQMLLCMQFHADECFIGGCKGAQKIDLVDFLLSGPLELARNANKFSVYGLMNIFRTELMRYSI